jgi:hypothetical protein
MSNQQNQQLSFDNIHRPSRVTCYGQELHQLVKSMEQRGAVVSGIECDRGCNARYVVRLFWPRSLENFPSCRIIPVGSDSHE